jgi:hypothetical protein
MVRFAVAAACLLSVLTINQSSHSAAPVETATDIAEAEVTQVIAAEDDGYRFRAYLVDWNGGPVVVSDPLCRSNFEKGDKVQFMVHKHRLTASGDGLLGFMLLSERAGDLPLDEQRRQRRISQGDLSAAKKPIERFHALGAAAKIAMDKNQIDEARKLAKELEGLVRTHKGDWSTGNAIQDSNQVLGRIALAEGDIEEAKRRLLASADSEGSPQMNSFGPNMQLAKELLEKGERETVIEYFRLCGKFWDMGDERLADWTALVKEGRTPDFGANLHY